MVSSVSDGNGHQAQKLPQEKRPVPVSVVKELAGDVLMVATPLMLATAISRRNIGRVQQLLKATPHTVRAMGRGVTRAAVRSGMKPKTAKQLQRVVRKVAKSIEKPMQNAAKRLDKVANHADSMRFKKVIAGFATGAAMMIDDRDAPKEGEVKEQVYEGVQEYARGVEAAQEKHRGNVQKTLLQLEVLEKEINQLPEEERKEQLEIFQAIKKEIEKRQKTDEEHINEQLHKLRQLPGFLKKSKSFETVAEYAENTGRAFLEIAVSLACGKVKAVGEVTTKLARLGFSKEFLDAVLTGTVGLVVSETSKNVASPVQNIAQVKQNGNTLLKSLNVQPDASQNISASEKAAARTIANILSGVVGVIAGNVVSSHAELTPIFAEIGVTALGGKAMEAVLPTPTKEMAREIVEREVVKPLQEDKQRIQDNVDRHHESHQADIERQSSAVKDIQKAWKEKQAFIERERLSENSSLIGKIWKSLLG